MDVFTLLLLDEYFDGGSKSPKDRMAKGLPLLLNLLFGLLVTIPDVARLVFPPPPFVLPGLRMYWSHSDLDMAANIEEDLYV